MELMAHTLVSVFGIAFHLFYKLITGGSSEKKKKKKKKSSAVSDGDTGDE
jgi:hypothetical protein